MTGTCILYIIISKLQKFCLIILFKIVKSLQTFFYYIILLFGLTINLRVKNNKKLLFNSKK